MMLGDGTQISTQRLSTGWDRAGRRIYLRDGEPQKSSFAGTLWDRPGWRQAHFETAPFDRSASGVIIYNGFANSCPQACPCRKIGMKISLRFHSNSLIKLVAGEGFEPPTLGL